MSKPLLSVDEAETLVLQHIRRFPTVTVPLADAGGCILRETLSAHRDAPPYDRAMMDGIGVDAGAWRRGRRAFRVEATLAAGQPAMALRNTEDGCIRIMTGAMVDASITAIIPVEELQTDGDQVHVTGTPDVTDGLYIHRKGSDRRAGDPLLHAGMRLLAPHIAILAANGRSDVSVSAMPEVSVLHTGDEIIPLNRTAEPHQIYPSNACSLVEALREAGVGKIRTIHLHDDPSAIADGLEEALADSGLVMISGGVSKGDYDYIPEALASRGVRKIFHGVAQKPGKPLWFGAQTDGPVVFGLPGNPVSTLVCFHRYVRPWLAASSGWNGLSTYHALVDEDVDVRHNLTTFLPVAAEPDGRGGLTATVLPYSGSGDYSALGDSSGFIELPRGRNRMPAGTPVRYHPWRV